jgi:hypothetical protein
MNPFVLLVAYDVFEFIGRLPRAEQQAVRRRLVQIRDYPYQHSDYAETDDIGRRLEINICGRLALKYWIDTADHHVKILDIHPADRRS